MPNTFSKTLSFFFNGTAMTMPADGQLPTILSLPPELLHKIFRNMDWGSLLAARRTCTTFLSVTKTRALWLKIIRRLQRLPHITSIEEPLADYTTEELETWALLRLRVEDAWDAKTQALRPFTITFPTDIHPRATRIIGRWLLVLLCEEVYYCDLDASIRQAKLLVAVPNDYEPHESEFFVPGWAVWVDKTKPKLTFRLVLSGCCLSGDWSARAWIYEVKLMGHGSDAVLTTDTPIAILNVPGESNPPAIILDEEHCIFTRATVRGLHDTERSWLCIYSYTTSQQIDEPVDPRIAEIGLDTFDICGAISIRSNRLLVITMYSIEVYDYSHAIQNTRFSSTLSPVYRFPHRVCRQVAASYNPVSINGATRIVLQARGTIIGLCIPDDPTIQPSTTILGSFDEIPSALACCTTGHSRSLLYHPNATLELLEHKWNSTSTFRTKYLECALPEKIRRASISMSEERGQFAMMQDNGVIVLSLF